MESITKHEHKQLRRLAGVAYGRELSRALAELDVAFGEWKAGRMSPHELSDAVHRFHDGVARDLYGLYTRLDPAHTVARALAIKLLAAEEVAPDLRGKIGPRIEFYASDAAPVP